MLHGKPAFTDIQTICYTEFFDVLLCYVGIGADIHHLEEIVLQFIPMPLAHQVDDLLCHEGLT